MGWNEIQAWLSNAAKTAAGVVSPPAHSPGAVGVAGIRSMLPGSRSFEQELEAYNRDAAPSPLYSPTSRFGSVVTDPAKPLEPSGGERERQMQMAMQMPMMGHIRAPGSPPLFRNQYVNERDIRKALRDQYVKDGAVVANSFETPAPGVAVPEGTWVIDDMHGLHGDEIGKSQRVDPTKLFMSEDTKELGRWPHVERYAEWRREGMEPPPVSVYENDRGGLKISDGHRRTHAAIQAGTDLPAIVWGTMEHPRGMIDSSTGKPMRVGLTYEGAMKEAVLEALKAEGPANEPFANTVRAVRGAASSQPPATHSATLAPVQVKDPPRIPMSIPHFVPESIAMVFTSKKSGGVNPANVEKAMERVEDSIFRLTGTDEFRSMGERSLSKAKQRKLDELYQAQEWLEELKIPGAK